MTTRARPRAARRVPIVAMLFVAIGAVVVVAARPAAAHAGFESSSPRAGELLASPPDAVEIAFTEPPDLDLSSVTMIEADGTPVETGPIERGAAPRSLRVALPDDLGDGVYTVSWQVVSTVDGHRTTDVFAFGVGSGGGEIEPATDGPAASTPAPSPLAVVGKVLLYAGLAVAVGCAVVGTVAFGGAVPRRRALLPAAGAAALVGATVMTVAEAGIVDASTGDLLSSDTGRSYVWLLVTTGLTLAAALVASRSSPRAPLVATGVAAAAAMFVRATSGHASALVPAWPAELTQFVHFLAIGVWIGGLVPLAALLVETRRAGSPPPVSQVRRFSQLAGWALLAVVGTGVLRTIGEAGGVGDVTRLIADTSYGTTLLVKVALALLLIGLGAVNRRRSIPRLADDGSLLRQVVAVELIAAVGVLALTGTLTSLNPNSARAQREPAPPAAASASGADFATTTRVTFTATPGTAGPNVFEARVVDFDDGTPLPADEVSVAMSPIGRPEMEPTTLELSPDGSADADAPAAWTATGTQLSIAGAWDLVVQVRDGARATEVPLVIVTRAPPATSVVAQGSGDTPDIETFTLSTGDQLQLYLDPGVAGANEYHVTAFDPTGEELPISGLVMVATGPDGAREVLDVTRLTAGHFAALVDVPAGRTTIDVVATTRGGTVLQATQELEVTA